MVPCWQLRELSIGGAPPGNNKGGVRFMGQQQKIQLQEIAIDLYRGLDTLQALAERVMDDVACERAALDDIFLQLGVSF